MFGRNTLTLRKPTHFVPSAPSLADADLEPSREDNATPKFDDVALQKEENLVHTPHAESPAPAVKEKDMDMATQEDKELAKLEKAVEDARASMHAAQQNLDAYRADKKAEVEAKMREMAAAYGIHVSFNAGTSRGPRKTRSDAGGRGTVAPKFKNQATGETWAGRGKPPKWMAGMTAEQREQYRIAD